MKKWMAAIMISTALFSTGVPSVKADTTYVNEDFTAYTGASGDSSLYLLVARLLTLVVLLYIRLLGGQGTGTSLFIRSER